MKDIYDDIWVSLGGSDAKIDTAGKETVLNK